MYFMYVNVLRKFAVEDKTQEKCAEDGGLRAEVIFSWQTVNRLSFSPVAQIVINCLLVKTFFFILVKFVSTFAVATCLVNKDEMNSSRGQLNKGFYYTPRERFRSDCITL